MSETKVHSHAVETSVGKHTSAEARASKRAVVARSLRGINRNLRLDGHPKVKVVKGSGKTKGCFLAVKGRARRIIRHETNVVKTVSELTYGQWVEAVAQTLKK
jgi:hypothetical protein